MARTGLPTIKPTHLAGWKSSLSNDMMNRNVLDEGCLYAITS